MEGSILIIFTMLVLLRYFGEFFLEILNMRFVKKARSNPPDFVLALTDRQSFEKSVAYNLDKGCFALVVKSASTLFLLIIIYSGTLVVLDKVFEPVRLPLLPDAARIVFIGAVALLFGLWALPFNLYFQFKIEEKHGFNRMTWGLYALDVLKTIILSVILLVPLLALLFFLRAHTGPYWWLAGAGGFILFQFFVSFLYPALIAPLFNKFSPLAEGPLKERILALAVELGFHTKGIYVMDGSKRSRHSNAYFTGFGKARRIIFFDTLIDDLTEDELIAVLAHEIGHYKKHHIQSGLVTSYLATLIGFFVLSLLVLYAPFFKAFGFSLPSDHTALVLFFLCSGPCTFFLGPLMALWSRSFEYQADRFAVSALHEKQGLRLALLKLSKNNLSNPVPHPLYSFYYYSHPTLGERLKAIDNIGIN